jgi:hypothetical protein
MADQETQETTQGNLRGKTETDSETRWADLWEATKPTPEGYLRGIFLADLAIASRKITDEINADPDEARSLREALRDADAGKAKPHRRRAPKSST